MNLDDRQSVVITSHLDDFIGSGYGIANGVVAWTEQVGTNPDQTGQPNLDVLAKDLTTGVTTVIAATNDQERFEAISANWVLYSVQHGGSYTEIARNLHTLDDPIEVPNHSLFGDNLAWAEPSATGNYGTDDWTIEVLHLGDAEPQAVASVAPNTSVVMVGTTVIYAFDLPANPGDPFVQQINALDLATGQTTTIVSESRAEVAGVGDQHVFLRRATAHGTLTAYDAWDVHTGQLERAMVTRDVPDVTPTVYDLSSAGGVLTWRNRDELHAASLDSMLAPLTPPDPATADPSWQYFPATGQYLRSAFQSYWAANGGLPVFGYPLTGEYQEQSADTGSVYATQYLERQRFEYHPEQSGTPYEVELGRLGAELLAAQGRDWTNFPKADPAAPNYVAETGHAIAPEFYDYWSSHGLELGDDGVSYRESVALFGYPLSELMTETNADGDTVMTQYFERAVFEYHPENAGTWYTVLLRRLGAEVLAARGW